MRRKFFGLSLVLVFAATIIAAAIAIGSASAQTAPALGAYVLWTCFCPGPACDAFCPYPNSAGLVTPFGSTSGPNDTEPTFSADGKQIAFNRNYDIYVMGANVGPVSITNTANNQDPAWSPDGARIAFMTTRDGHSELYLMNPDGSNVVRLTYNIAVSVGHPAWSRDGARIAFNCQVDSGNDDICAINPDGTGFVRVTTDPAHDGGPTWSPDGATIAFATTRYGADSELAVMNPDGTGVTRVGSGVVGSSPVWSPDGTQIAFDGNPADPSWAFVAIYTVNADGTNVAWVADSAQDPAWTPMQVPVAAFKFSCNGTTCNFDASGSKNSYGTITTYAWSFGDQTTGTGAIVSHTYAGGGAYTAKLTVTDSSGATGTRFQAITINPVAAFTFSCGGLTCNFDASGSQDSSATIVGYNWSFGDGAGGAGVTVNHTYRVGNSYNVILTVTDSTGATGTQSQTININSRPVASFTFACNLLTCSFDGSGSQDPDATITSYAWNFGDGATGSAPTLSHTYAAGGRYTVTLIVTDNAGASNAQSQTAAVNAPPVASFTFSCSRFTCVFDASGSYDSDGSISSWTWNFGDATPMGNSELIGHTYRAPGTYTVTLTVTDNGGATGVKSSNVRVPVR
jgi:PKD repeat protein